MNKIIGVFVSSRFKSFYWRAIIMGATAMLAFIAQNLDMFSLSPQVTVVLGLVLGEIVKGLNNWTQNKPMGFAR